jgi:predicted phosphodiesterase
MSKLQVLSDLHLEFRGAYESLPFIPVNAPILCLLGDIGYPSDDVYRKFLLAQADRFWKVVVIAGNHEYYTSPSIEATNALIADICSSRDNLHFLNNSTLRIPEYNLTLCGGTLWSHIPSRHAQVCGRDSRDFRHIRKVTDVGTTKLTVAMHNKLHKQCVDWLSEVIETTKLKNKSRTEGEKERLVILTHHAPTRHHTLNGDQKRRPTKYLDFTSLEHLFGDPVAVWAFGHTHRTSRQRRQYPFGLCNSSSYYSML